MRIQKIICQSIWLLIVVMFAACNKNDKLSMQISDVYTTKAIASASGIAVKNDSVLIVGDDEEFVLKMNMSDHKYREIELYSGASKERIAKDKKHDLESCTFAQIGNTSFLLAFGSGSVSPQRDSLFGISDTDSLLNFKMSIGAFYDVISHGAGLQKGELDIEGAALLGNYLLLFNRGKNLVISVPWNEMEQFILHPEKNILPSFAIAPIELPVVNNYRAGLSGACVLDKNTILFTASLEETTDLVKDGEVKGSYIGILKVEPNNFTVDKLSLVKDAAGNNILDKLESIDIIDRKGKTINAVAVADNDDGVSKIFRIKIDY